MGRNTVGVCGLLLGIIEDCVLRVEGPEGNFLQVENTFRMLIPYSKFVHGIPDRKYSYVSMITGEDSNRPSFPALQCSIHVLH